MRILLTGGMGFIGSHTAVVLLEAGHHVVLFDNLSNADRSVAERITRIAGRAPVFVEGDIRDRDAMERTLRDEKIDTVIHFAGLKAVGESVAKPLEYYDNNVTGSLRLLEAMRATGVKRLIFSSSSTVYGTPQHLPLTEAEPLGEPTNPYGRTKLHIEAMLADACRAYPDLSVVCLRYFNPIGAHPSGLIGEDPNGIPNNLLPYVARVANGRLPALRIFGNDYDTPDGTCIRDYIYVVDLAKAHVKAMERVLDTDSDRLEVFNVGTGHGVSTKQIIDAFEKATGVKLNWAYAPRRAGDIEKVWANPEKANKVLGWKAETCLEDTLKSAWNWQKHLREEGIQ